MTWPPHLNPTPWRDEDQHRRLSVEPPPPCGLSAALHANFPVVPLPAEFQAALDKLR